MLDDRSTAAAARLDLLKRVNELIELAARFAEIGNDPMAKELQDLAQGILEAERVLAEAISEWLEDGYGNSAGLFEFLPRRGGLRD